jgi:ABC-type Fe3+ transport system permease subunit
MMPTFVALFIWMFVHSIREFSIAVILQSGKNEVLSTLLFNYWINSFPNYAAAISAMLMAALLVLAIVFGWFVRESPSRHGV